MTATVVEPFSNNEIGKVSINDQLWRATSMNNESFDVGEKVIIIAFSGAKLVISKTENENIIRL
jgi:membrane protein implicated in regulation of membrane protease activity